MEDVVVQIVANPSAAGHGEVSVPDHEGHREADCGHPSAAGHGDFADDRRALLRRVHEVGFEAPRCRCQLQLA